MESNAPIERLLSAVMSLDSCADSPGYASEMRCLMRKIEWAANEAEAAVRRCEAATEARRTEQGRIETAA